MAIVEDIFYDTEFWEQGHEAPVDLISIGMKKRSLGWGYYAVNREFDLHGAWHYAGPSGDYWLRENVLKQLPLVLREDGSIWLDGDGTPMLDTKNASVKSRIQIRADLEKFLELHDVSRKRRLWAWYADYDHVVLSQIWGTMAQLPRGMPMFTHDLKQVVDLAGNPAMPDQLQGHHHALDDAAHLQVMWEYCAKMGILVPPRFQSKTPLTPRPIRDNPQA
jgi:hypothetical protein